jgi:hypothetical protein
MPYAKAFDKKLKKTNLNILFHVEYQKVMKKNVNKCVLYNEIRRKWPGSEADIVHFPYKIQQQSKKFQNLPLLVSTQL